MSLYTFSNRTVFPFINKPAGLTINESTDISLLSALGNTTIEEVRNRLANDHLAFVAFVHQRPAAFGWMARGKAKIGELDHEFILPEKNRYLWNFRTLMEYRGLGIYPALLQYIMQYEGNKANRFWIIHAPENKSSLKGIVKAGFEYAGKLYAGNNGIKIEASAAGENLSDLLEYMDIPLSNETSASCWNCSSPYLKKRKPECCCAEANTECIGKTVFSMAS